MKRINTGCLTFLIFIFLACVLLGSGIQFHPEAVPDYFRPVPKGPFRRLDFNDGRFLVGEFVRESEREIELRLAGKRVVFPKSLLSGTREVSEAEVESGKYPDWFPELKKRPILTRGKGLSLKIGSLFNVVDVEDLSRKLKRLA